MLFVRMDTLPCKPLPSYASSFGAHAYKIIFCIRPHFVPEIFVDPGPRVNGGTDDSLLYTRQQSRKHTTRDAFLRAILWACLHSVGGESTTLLRVVDCQLGLGLGLVRVNLASSTSRSNASFSMSGSESEMAINLKLFLNISAWQAKYKKVTSPGRMDASNKRNRSFSCLIPQS